MRFLATIVAALIAILSAAIAANTHAHLDHATPAVGSTVATAPKEVVLWFSEKLEAAFSTIEVRNAKGVAVQSGKAIVDRANHAQMRVSLKPLAPGTYRVFWRVLSVDTHRAQGGFTFRVGP
jgi:copper resistance protein C